MWLQQVVRHEEVTQLQQCHQGMAKGAICRFLRPRYQLGLSVGGVAVSAMVFDYGKV